MKTSRFTFLLFFLITNLLFCSCSQSKNANLSNSANNANAVSYVPNDQPPKLVTVKARIPDEEPLNLTGELKYGNWSSVLARDRSLDYYRQKFCLASSETVDESMQVTSEAGYIELCFTINDNKRREDKRPIAPGVYYMMSPGAPQMGRISEMVVTVAQGDRRREGLLDLSSTYGNLTIETSTENFISGKFALSDEFFTVNGSFAANLQ